MYLGDRWLCVKVITGVSGSTPALYYDYGLFITDLHVLLVISVRVYSRIDEFRVDPLYIIS